MYFQSLRQKVTSSRFVGFAMVGGGVFVAGLLLLSFLVETMGMDKLLAGVIVTFLTLEANFLGNKYINWSDRQGNFAQQWWRFHVVRAGGLAVNQVAYVALVARGLNYAAVSIVLMLLITAYNYVGSDKIAFS